MPVEETFPIGSIDDVCKALKEASQSLKEKMSGTCSSDGLTYVRGLAKGFRWSQKL